MAAEKRVHPVVMWVVGNEHVTFLGLGHLWFLRENLSYGVLGYSHDQKAAKIQLRCHRSAVSLKQAGPTKNGPRQGGPGPLASCHNFQRFSQVRLPGMTY